MSAWHPPCFTRQQWNAWRAVARQCGEDPELQEAKYCVDCTPEYQQQMVAEGRCLHPEVRFKLDADGLIVGTRKAA